MIELRKKRAGKRTAIVCLKMLARSALVLVVFWFQNRVISNTSRLVFGKAPVKGNRKAKTCGARKVVETSDETNLLRTTVSLEAAHLLAGLILSSAPSLEVN